VIEVTEVITIADCEIYHTVNLIFKTNFVLFKNEKTMETKKYEVQSGKSSIDWVGRKVTGAHHGTVSIKEGSFVVAGDQIIGGKVIINVASIKILDLTDPATNFQLAGHLASYDFFYSDEYPEATFEVTSVSGSQMNGYLTIKGITHPLNFDAITVRNENTLTASGKIVIDRTKYGIKFRSGNFFKNLGACLIYNDFDLDVNITAVTLG
jgi:polyisoprenoid-binding protein YceI